MKYVFVLTTLFTIPFNCIATGEGFEDAKKLEKIFKNEKGLKRKSIWTFRALFLAISYMVTMMIDEIAVILDLGGSLITPFLSYIFPVSLFY